MALVAMQENRKLASRNSESTLSHRPHSLNLVHPSSWGLCTPERTGMVMEVVMEEEEAVVLVLVLVCICDF